MLTFRSHFTCIFCCFKRVFPLHLLASLRTLYILGSILSVDSVAIHVSQAMDGRVLVYNVSGDGAPTFQLRASTAVHQTDQMAMLTDRHPSSDSYTSHFKRSLQLTREWKSSLYIPWLPFGNWVQAVDSGAHFKFHRLQIAEYPVFPSPLSQFNTVGESFVK